MPRDALTETKVFCKNGGLAPRSLALMLAEFLKSLVSCQCTKIKLVKVLKKAQLTCLGFWELTLTKKERKTQKHHTDEKAEGKRKSGRTNQLPAHPSPMQARK